MPQNARWGIGTDLYSIANWVNGTDLCSSTLWGIGTEDCSSALWGMRIALYPSENGTSGNNALILLALNVRDKMDHSRR